MHPSCAAESFYPAGTSIGFAGLSVDGRGSPAGSAENVGDLILGTGLAVRFELTTDETVRTWARKLTMGESLRLAVQVFRSELSKLSWCAA